MNLRIRSLSVAPSRRARNRISLELTKLNGLLNTISLISAILVVILLEALFLTSAAIVHSIRSSVSIGIVLGGLALIFVLTSVQSVRTQLRS